MVMGMRADQLVNRAGLTQVGLGDDAHLFEPLQDAVHGCFGQVDAVSLQALLELAQRDGRLARKVFRAPSGAGRSAVRPCVRSFVHQFIECGFIRPLVV